MKPADTAMARMVDDELVILDLRSGEYYSLNRVGAAVWKAIEHGTDRSGVVEAVVERFEVDQATAVADVESLIAELTNAGLLVD